MIYTSIDRADPDVRKELLTNIVMVGGGSLFPNIGERVQDEVAEKLPSSFRAKVVMGTPVERRFSVFIGGSILSNLGSFQQLWLTKQEYQEMGIERSLERFDA